MSEQETRSATDQQIENLHNQGERIEIGNGEVQNGSVPLTGERSKDGTQEPIIAAQTYPRRMDIGLMLDVVPKQDGNSESRQSPDIKTEAAAVLPLLPQSVDMRSSPKLESQNNRKEAPPDETSEMALNNHRVASSDDLDGGIAGVAQKIETPPVIPSTLDNASETETVNKNMAAEDAVSTEQPPVDLSHYAPGNALAVLADLSSVAPHQQSPTLPQGPTMSSEEPSLPISPSATADTPTAPAPAPVQTPTASEQGPQPTSPSTSPSVSALAPSPSAPVQAVTAPTKSMQDVAVAQESEGPGAASDLITPPGSNERASVKPTASAQKASSTKREFGVTPIDGPPKMEYPVDAGIIRCICGFDDDDGFTIQCEKCNAWQHAQCVDIVDEAHAPDIYYCDQCSDRKVDVQLAVERQIKRIQSGKRRKPRSATKSKEDGGRSGLSTRSSSPSKPSSSKETGVDDGSQTGPERKDTSSGRDLAKDAGKGAGKRGRRKQKPTKPLTATEDDSESDSEFPNARAKLYESHFVRIDTNRFFSDAVAQFVETIPSLDIEEEVYSELSQTEYRAIRPVKLFVRSTADPTRMQQFRGFSKYGVFVESSIPRDRFIGEFLGEVMFQKDYKSNPINQYRFYGCPKPGVIFVPSLPLAVDGRRVGSETSFIRYSCKPNIRFSTIAVVNGDAAKAERVHFAAFAVEPIRPGSELTVGWEFDPNHPVRRLLAGEDVSALSQEERDFLASSAAVILERGVECACDTPADCVLTLMKKAETGTRSTRAGTKKHFEKRASTEEASSRPSRSTPRMQSNETPMEPTVYSALVERRLEDALSIIDGIVASGKRKRPEDLYSNGSISTSESPIEEPVSLSSRGVQTDPFQKKLHDETVQTAGKNTSSILHPRKRRLVRFLEAKKTYDTAAAAKSAESPSSCPNSPNMALLSRATFGSDPLTMTPRVSFSAIYSEDNKDVKEASPGVVTTSAKSALTSPVIPSFATPSNPPQGIMSLPSASASTPGVKPVKKLSFADYKKKQKPISAVSRSASPSPGPSPTTATTVLDASSSNTS